MNAPATPLYEGQILAGKYRVERVLGQGGMGVVLAAQHIQLEERVAIKLMLDDAACNADAVARFVREARAAARLQSAHVARVSDVGTLEDGRPYMVMEYLDGSDLSQVLSASGPLAVQDAVDYLLQAAEAIAEAHSIGIVHRDLKPANLFLTRRRDRTPHVKVLDFGISKVSMTSESDHAMTRTGVMMGSPLYMSPEQMTSVRDVDARSDIWALGIILFELLTGSPPFVGETLPQVCGLVIQAEAPPASSRRADLPVEIDAIIQRCLAKNPNDRYQNVAKLALALQGLAGRHGRASVERIVMLSGDGEPASVPHGPSTTFVAGAAVPAATGHVVQGTHANWGETKPPVPARPNKGWLAIPLLGIPGIAVGAWWFLAVPHGESVTPKASVSVGTAAEPVVSVLALEPAPVAPVPPAPAASASASPAPGTPSAVAAMPLPIRKSSGSSKRPSIAKEPKPVVAAAPVATPVAAPVATPVATPEPKKPSTMGGRL